VITYLRVNKLLFISIASFKWTGSLSLLPSATWDYRSEPARSTSCSFEIMTLSALLTST